MSGDDYRARLKTAKRNDPCPCGSGRKYKKCHLAEDEKAASAEADKLAAEAAAAAAAAAEAEEGEEGTAAKKADAPAAGGRSKRGSQQQPKGKGGNTRPQNLPRRKAV